MKYSVLWIIKTNSSQGVQIWALNSALMNNLMLQFMKDRSSKTCAIQLQFGRLLKKDWSISNMSQCTVNI